MLWPNVPFIRIRFGGVQQFRVSFMNMHQILVVCSVVHVIALGEMKHVASQLNYGKPFLPARKGRQEK